MRLLHSIILGISLSIASAGAFAGKVNINEADAAVLADLNGIGVAKAEAIIAYRKTHGPFRTVDDLANVKGIGPAFIDKNREQITVGEPSKVNQKAAVD
jgi:competence protein ComEA